MPISNRLLFAFGAVALLVVVATARMRAAMHGARPGRNDFDPAERAKRIRESRGPRRR